MGIKKLIAALCVLAGLAIAAGVEVRNPDLLAKLTPEQKSVLAKQGMVARTTDYDHLYDVYEAAAEDNLPIVVLTDPLLHAFHILFDYSLRTAELDHFYPKVRQMLEVLLEHETAFRNRVRDKNAKKALEQNIAFLAVPLTILDSNYKIPALVQKPVKAELALIEAHEGFDTSEVLGTLEDFSQYKPRGHYTRNREFERYFKAMMYLGRMAFLFDPPGSRELGIRLTRQAILLAEAMEHAEKNDVPAREHWRTVYEPTAYMVGEAEDPLPGSYYRLYRKLAQDADIAPWVGQDSNINRFIASACSLPSPRILSTLRRDVEPETGVQGMRLMGQRYIPDSDMFQQLVYDKVGTQGNPRVLPMGLDVMAVLGSARARKHLVDVYKQGEFAGYLRQLDSLTTAFGNLNPDDWNRNAYYGWLYALKLNLEPVSEAGTKSSIAEFCRSEAYPDKTLVSSCGSWAELRHDTILYAKQSYTVFATAMPPAGKEPEDVAYVEPKPRVFGQLAKLADGLKTGLIAAGIVHPQVTPKLTSFASTARALEEIAAAELEGKPLTAEQVKFAKGIGAVLAELTTFTSLNPEAQEEFERYTSDEDKKMALVADVHTDPNTGQVLQEAVGNPCEFYAVIPFQGRKYLGVGACFSYYEFTKPLAERMTDSEWQALSPKPEMPVWTRSFIVR